MQLRSLIGAVLLVVIGATAASAQSLSPMRNAGDTPTDIKGFKLAIGNPYKTRMVFEVIPMDPKFKVVATDAAVNFAELAMAPGTTRQVIVTFRIDPHIKERTIGVCVQPKQIEGTVLPRVCGTYTGRLKRAGS